MKGNDKFRESQKAADRDSNSRAERIIKESDVAQAYYLTIRSSNTGDKDDKRK